MNYPKFRKTDKIFQHNLILKDFSEFKLRNKIHMNLKIIK